MAVTDPQTLGDEAPGGGSSIKPISFWRKNGPGISDGAQRRVWRRAWIQGAQMQEARMQGVRMRGCNLSPGLPPTWGRTVSSSGWLPPWSEEAEPTDPTDPADSRDWRELWTVGWTVQ